MTDPKEIFGRLGNSMFQYAALYSFAKDFGTDYYFQNPEWFEKYQDEIRVLFSSDIPDSCDKVAIHIRRGDYVNNPFYVDLTKTTYYQRALALFPKEQFLIFSDDTKWVEEEWKLYDKTRMAISYGGEIEDLNKMASCKAHIIANSSFSWWGAWLCPKYPNNRVVAPREWYSDGVQRTILPSHWVKI